MNESLLAYRSFLYLKLAAALVLAALVFYSFDRPTGGVANGGTWLGYVLGTIGALLILWLMWFGVRKRRYGIGRVPLEGWLSAHVYLGLALMLVATLHTGFHFGWNVHTLAYALMTIVILSGAFGVYVYLRYPSMITENRAGMTLGQLANEIGAIDGECRRIALPLADDINRLMMACSHNVIAGSLMQRLSGRVRGCTTEQALATMSQLGTESAGRSMAEMERIRKLVALLTRKSELLYRARTDVQMKSLLEIWLYLHVPLSIGLLAALTVHVISVFFFW